MDVSVVAGCVCGAAAEFDDLFCEACGGQLRTGTDRVETDLGALAGVSDRGLRRSRNEDAMALAVDGGLLAAVVCDGVSSAPSGDLAARGAAAAALAVLMGAADPAAACGRTHSAVLAAADAVAHLNVSSPDDAPACTFVSAVVERSGPGRPVTTIGWVGDSRAYWLAGGGQARLLTADHAVAGTHTITRWLGIDCAPEADLVAVRPLAPGALLLCTDGLWNHIADPDQLAAIALPALAEGGASAAATALTGAALQRGGHDNVTVVVIPS